jgi:hypothetical protein
MPDDDGHTGGSPPSTETQLAVIRIQLSQLIELNKTRGEDHETRLRKLEERRFPLQTVAVLMSTFAVLATVAALLLKL